MSITAFNGGSSTLYYPVIIKFYVDNPVLGHSLDYHALEVDW